MTITFDKQEAATVLAALRFWQRVGLKLPVVPPEEDIATDAGEFSSLDEFAIDDLCERINMGGDD